MWFWRILEPIWPITHGEVSHAFYCEFLLIHVSYEKHCLSMQCNLIWTLVFKVFYLIMIFVYQLVGFNFLFIYFPFYKSIKVPFFPLSWPLYNLFPTYIHSLKEVKPPPLWNQQRLVQQVEEGPNTLSLYQGWAWYPTIRNRLQKNPVCASRVSPSPTSRVSPQQTKPHNWHAHSNGPF